MKEIGLKTTYNIKLSNTFVFSPVALSLLLLLILHGATYFSSGGFLPHVNFPLITYSDVAASGDIVVFSQKYLNRVQVYNSQAEFVSGFPLRGTSSSFAIAITDSGKIIDCTAIRGDEPLYDVYSTDGQQLRRDEIQSCKQKNGNNALSNGSIVTAEKRFWGYKIIVTSAHGEELFETDINPLSYLFANLLYLPITASISLILAFFKLFTWRFLPNRKN